MRAASPQAPVRGSGVRQHGADKSADALPGIEGSIGHPGLNRGIRGKTDVKPQRKRESLNSLILLLMYSEFTQASSEGGCRIKA